MSHLRNFNDDQLVKALKPLLVHDNWDYLEEYLRRERDKRVGVGMTSKDPVDIYRAQGATEAINKLVALKHRVLEAS